MWPNWIRQWISTPPIARSNRAREAKYITTDVIALVAHPVEQVTRNDQVLGSRPSECSKLNAVVAKLAKHLPCKQEIRQFDPDLRLQILCRASSIGRAAVSKADGWGFESLALRHICDSRL